jgi:hypothetical protein
VILGAEAEVEVMKRGHVHELMGPPPPVLGPGADLEQIRRATLDADLRATFIVDEAGAVIGLHQRQHSWRGACWTARSRRPRPRPT